jgi:hypothetical protein
VYISDDRNTIVLLCQTYPQKYNRRHLFLAQPMKYVYISWDYINLVCCRLNLFIKSFTIVSLINSLQIIKVCLCSMLSECASFSEAEINEMHHSFRSLYIGLIVWPTRTTWHSDSIHWCIKFVDGHPHLRCLLFHTFTWEGQSLHLIAATKNLVAQHFPFSSMQVL